MTHRSFVACICLFLGMVTLSLSCKKGCGTCRSYGVQSGARYVYMGDTDYYVSGLTQQVCVNNFCTCPNGQEGDSCQIYTVHKYFQPSPSWTVSDVCSGDPTYSVFVTTSASYPYTVFYLNNLFGSGSAVAVNIQSTADNQGTGLVIPVQTLGDVTFSGTGSYSVVGTAGHMVFNMDYNNNATGVDIPCTLSLYQQ